MGDLAAGLRERLALLGGERRGQLARVLLDQGGGLAQECGALLDVGSRPVAQRALSRGHGELNVLSRPRRDGVDDGLRRRVEYLEFLMRGGLAPLPSDQHLGHADSSFGVATAGLTKFRRDYTLADVSQVSHHVR